VSSQLKLEVNEMGARKLWKECSIIVHQLGYSIELVEDHDYRCYDEPPELWKQMKEDGVIACAGTVLRESKLVLIRRSLTMREKASVLAHEMAHLLLGGPNTWLKEDFVIDVEMSLCKEYGFTSPYYYDPNYDDPSGGK